MGNELHIGIVDSGHAPEQAGLVLAGRRFFLTDDGVGEGELVADALRHGSAVLQAIASRAPAVRFSVAQVFDGRGVTSPLQIAAALHWLRERGVRLVNLSLGVRQDRPLLREAVAALVADGVLVCASSPAQGEPVFPASYPGVIRVTGDARCGAGEWSWLDTRQADFGAAVSSGGQAGSSLGCAALCGHLAALLAEHPEADNAWLLQRMREGAAYKGREFRVAP
ncbi:subtilisin-like serine protease QhpE [Pseudomonas schmalbachii]|uniref:Peptidase S8 and S53 subtilisin kexin sedolisin n=1 Tax=Pseudomonas schmalbachii TaxID=2816993 RepID=A0ABS3TP61_9PSED|nr:peptidase S8 and S53 subtilisin kexin sedolisin [Pseudomonas schmalbachii]MBO3275456.1 peptidase S8 and S53 subtilisin kexin sedolisin [Pseudomonas schmalbachii]